MLSSKFKDRMLMQIFQVMKSGLRIRYMGGVGRDEHFDKSFGLVRGRIYTIQTFKFRNDLKLNCNIVLKELQESYNVGTDTVYAFAPVNGSPISYKPKNKPRKEY